MFSYVALLSLKTYFGFTNSFKTSQTKAANLFAIKYEMFENSFLYLVVLGLCFFIIVVALVAKEI